MLPVSLRAEASQAAEIVVRHEGPRGCSSAREFIGRVAPRLPALRFVEGPGEAGLEIILRQTAEGVSADLLIHLEDGGTLSRSILASSCDEATEAIAFVASVALDPGAAQPVTVQTARTPEEVAGRSGDEAPLLEDHGEGGAERRRGRRHQPGEGATIGWLGVGAALGLGVAPEPMWGPELGLTWATATMGVWSPALVVTAQYLLLDGYRQPTGVASFHQGRATLAFCPAAAGGRVLSARACLGMAGGWVESEGSQTDSPAQATRPYFDGHLAARLQLHLGRQSALVLSGYLAVPWIRDSYEFDGVVFHRTSPVTGGLALSIGARLW